MASWPWNTETPVGAQLISSAVRAMLLELSLIPTMFSMRHSRAISSPETCTLVRPRAFCLLGETNGTPGRPPAGPCRPRNTAASLCDDRFQDALALCDVQSEE